jgi:hypothetical protein
VETYRPQQDCPTASVIAQQYSSATLLPLAPSIPQGKILRGFKNVIISFLL